MGLPSGACKPYVGQPVACKGQGRKLLDPHGHVLGTVSLPGGARDIRHREIQLTMVSDLIQDTDGGKQVSLSLTQLPRRIRGLM